MTLSDLHACGLTEVGHWVNFTGIKLALGTESRPAIIREVTADALVASAADGEGHIELAMHPAGLALSLAALDRGATEVTIYGHQVLRIGERWASYVLPGDLTPCQAEVDDPGFSGGPFN